jgi:DNA-binding SARP family transcriptional activator
MITEAEPTVAPALMGTVQIRLLGSLEVVAPAGTPIAINGQKLRTLLAALALQPGQVITSDRLIDTIYGDDLPKCAENALQALVSTLRRSLRAGGVAGSVVVNDGTGYRLDIGRVGVDTTSFVQLIRDARPLLDGGDPAEASGLLHAALASWRGDALDGMNDCDVINGARLRLEELRLVALEDCIACDLDLGRHQRWLGDLEGLVHEHPLRERLWGHLMVAQYRAGRQAAALRSFQRARQQLTNQLGIAPGPELRRIEAAVLAHDAAMLLPSGTNDVTIPAEDPRGAVTSRADGRHPLAPRHRCRSPRQVPSGFHERWGVYDRLGSPHAA